MVKIRTPFFPNHADCQILNISKRLEKVHGMSASRPEHITEFLGSKSISYFKSRTLNLNFNLGLKSYGFVHCLEIDS